ncbi:hypothetical protein [Halomonas sp. KO116]|uniref:hypothetical protein n=1 Tax=Halomonas sp. KO116 TaxID=1504981 RepID=UPI0004E2F9E5|nr:hypothetical protein [Halomonas sp. KO116]AJY52501.1 hypothetical protein KO116_04038 [Halomonas sp. KO116]
MSRPNEKFIKQLAEIRDIAQAHERLAEIMGDVNYMGQGTTEQQAEAWSVAFRCMGKRAADMAQDLLEQSIEGDDDKQEGGHIAD